MPNGVTVEFEGGEREREIFVQGYQQAEKDLKLSWEDVKLIRETMDEVWDNYLEGKLKEDMFGDKEYYGEILRRYNAKKESDGGSKEV